MDINLKQMDRSRLKAFFNFDTMLLPSLVKIIFILGVGVILLSGLALPFLRGFGTTIDIDGGRIRESFSFDFGRFLVGVVISVIATSLGLLWWRIVCETMIILFKIREDLSAMRGSPAAVPVAAPAPEKPAAPPPPA